MRFAHPTPHAGASFVGTIEMEVLAPFASPDPERGHPMIEKGPLRAVRSDPKVPPYPLYGYLLLGHLPERFSRCPTEIDTGDNDQRLRRRARQISGIDCGLFHWEYYSR